MKSVLQVVTYNSEDYLLPLFTSLKILDAREIFCVVVATLPEFDTNLFWNSW